MPDNTPTARIRRILDEAIALRNQLMLLRATINHSYPDLAAGLPPAIKTPAIDHEHSYQRILGGKVDANRQYARHRRRKWAETIGVAEPPPTPAPKPLPVLEPIQPDADLDRIQREVLGPGKQLDPEVEQRILREISLDKDKL